MAEAQYTWEKGKSYVSTLENTWFKINIHGQSSVYMSAFVKKHGRNSISMTAFVKTQGG